MTLIMKSNVFQLRLLFTVKRNNLAMRKNCLAIYICKFSQYIGISYEIAKKSLISKEIEPKNHRSFKWNEEEVELIIDCSLNQFLFEEHSNIRNDDENEKSKLDCFSNIYIISLLVSLKNRGFFDGHIKTCVLKLDFFLSRCFSTTVTFGVC